MYWKYLKYVARHKWYTFLECCRLGIPITGLLHDWHKLLPDEFLPYARNFYGENTPSKPKATLDAFNYAWLKHISRSRHHPEWYVLGFDKVAQKPLVFEMPLRRRKEMVADWRGVGMALHGKDDSSAWYNDHREAMVLGPETRAWVESEMVVQSLIERD